MRGADYSLKKTRTNSYFGTDPLENTAWRTCAVNQTRPAQSCPVRSIDTLRPPCAPSAERERERDDSWQLSPNSLRQHRLVVLPETTSHNRGREGGGRGEGGGREHGEIQLNTCRAAATGIPTCPGTNCQEHERHSDRQRKSS